jgi:putative Mg2+ transporter-C (MgtC) family protein
VPTLHIVARIALAGALGALIGVERELHQRTAGLRTNTLIAVGSALFTILSSELAASTGADATRIAAQIVTGIGFLGAGAILHTGVTVKGLTTAATIWVNAGIGMAAGGGKYRIAVIATLTTLVILRAMMPLDRYFERRGAESVTRAGSE